jgi:hypothetical protein
MKKILLFVTLITTIISAQSFQIKQITNLNADCRNFFCGRYFKGSVLYTFEAHTGNSSSIYLGQYFQAADSFSIVTNVTNDNFMNINPKLIYSNDSVFIIYQTNKNGNWDIAYRVYLNSQLSPAYYLADSSSDETNPVVVSINDLSGSPENQIVSYEKGNSVFIREVNIPNSVESEVFHGDDSTKYSQVSQEIDYHQVFFIAARKVISGKSFIVYKQFSSKGWSYEITLVNSGTCRRPKIHEIDMGEHGLSYTDDINGKSNVILIENFNLPIDTLTLFGFPLYNYDNFWTMRPILVSMNKQFYNYRGTTYTASRNDSLFIRLNLLDGMDYGQYDTLVYTKVNNNHLYLGNFGSIYQYWIYYTIWEDSISGNIQLFGKRYLSPISGVSDDKYSLSSFTLYQNYPNPFNPSTTISYRLKETGFVKLNVYNITGKLIKTLVSQTQNPGSYETQFNAKGLASGIYFYRLEVFGKGSSPVVSEIKKLVLLK